MADDLAKEGSKLPQPSVSATYEEVKTILRSKFQNDWVSKNDGYRHVRDPIRTLERHHQTIIYRLRTGHCGLRSHLKRIGVADTALCECGQADQTPAHILQECTLQAEKRAASWPNGADLNTKLWGNATDLRRTAGFAASLGLQL